MFKNQKKVFMSFLLAYGGIFTMVSTFILLYLYINIFKEPFGNVFSIIGICFLILSTFSMICAQYFNPMFNTRVHPIHSGLIEGVPNNHKNQFSFKINQLININEITLYEKEKGVFYNPEEELNIKFDMRYWLKKKYYIYEYILTCLQLEYSTKIYKKVFVYNISKLDIIFINRKNKQKKYSLVSNNFTCLTLKYKYRIIKKLQLISNTKKFIISDFYNI